MRIQFWKSANAVKISIFSQVITNESSIGTKFSGRLLTGFKMIVRFDVILFPLYLVYDFFGVFSLRIPPPKLNIDASL